jgi:hypothetical protein
MSNTTIHEYNKASYYTGNSMVIDEKGAIPPYWTAAPFPEIPAGQFAMFNGVSWYLTSEPQPEPQPAPEPPVAAVKSDELPASATVI